VRHSSISSWASITRGAARSAFPFPIAAALALGCAGNPAPEPLPPNAPPPDPALAQQAASTNAITKPLQITFDFELTERDGKYPGTGVTRAAPPDRARLDLFGPRDEAYLKAALIGMQLNLPPNSRAVPLPPPPLLWSVLGVFTPPPDAALRATTQNGQTLTLDYASGDDRWRFRFENGKLRHAEWSDRSSGLRTVELTGAGQEGVPQKAVYRDHRERVELTLNLKSVQAVDGFPADIWSVGQN
jgi:hypothetical protein